MPAATTTNRPAGAERGAIMATTTRTTRPALRPGTARWLSAAGHPGYGPRFAGQVRDLMVSEGRKADLADLVQVSRWAFAARQANNLRGW
jgi:hypothetical protein